MTINKQLVKAQADAELTTSDMGHWFGVGVSTMAAWLQGIAPHRTRHSQINDKLTLLQKAVKAGKHFPVPLHVTQFKRKAYLQQVMDAVTCRVSSSRSSKQRV